MVKGSLGACCLKKRYSIAKKTNMKKIIATSAAALVIVVLAVSFILTRNKDKKEEIPEMETGMPQTMMQMPSPGQSGRNVSAFDTNISVTPAEGGMSISNIYLNSKDLNGKTVKVRGQVVKVNNAVMDKNWVHIQDGTNGNGEYDLTITTLEQVIKGDIVTFEGTLNLDRDFGAGYVYAVILEDAKLILKETAK
jgi:hypothetical protein